MSIIEIGASSTVSVVVRHLDHSTSRVVVETDYLGDMHVAIDAERSYHLTERTDSGV
jgi:hypothetical protein